MRNVLAVAAAAWSTGAWAQDAQPDGAALLDALARSQAYACTIGAEAVVIALREVPEGGLELVGAAPGAQVIREDGRIVVLQGTDYLQIDGANSAAISGGQVTQGTCSDLSFQFYEAVVLALGDDSPEALASMRSNLVSRLQTANEDVAALQAELGEARAEQDRLAQSEEALASTRSNLLRRLQTANDDVGTLRAELEEARVEHDRLAEVVSAAAMELDEDLPECLALVRGTLPIVKSLLESGAGAESSARATRDRTWNGSKP